MVMAKVPPERSPDSAVTAVAVIDTAMSVASADDSVILISAGEPSVTGFCTGEREMVGVMAGVAASPLTRMRRTPVVVSSDQVAPEVVGVSTA